MLVKRRTLYKSLLGTKEIIADFNRIRTKIILVSVLTICWTVFSIATKRQFYEQQLSVQFSRIDGYVLMDNVVMKGWVLIPLAIFLFSSILENESIQFLIRKQSRVNVLCYESIKIFLLSIYLTIIEMFSIEITNMILCTEKMNWSNKYSVFWLETGQTFDVIGIDYILVMLLFFITTVIGLVLFGMLFLVTSYCCNQQKLPYLICIIAIILRIEFRDLIGQYGIQYKQWLGWDKGKILLQILIVVCLILIARKLILRKDFYEK
jgi:hypothetical protein